jgi:hypothetical protein
VTAVAGPEAHHTAVGLRPSLVGTVLPLVAAPEGRGADGVQRHDAMA